MVVYDSAALYVASASDIRGKITKVDNIISALMDTAIKAATNDNILEYTLDDGQTIIKTTYRGAAQVLASIKDFETIKQMYMNQLNGRMIRLVDEKNFRGYGFNCR